VDLSDTFSGSRTVWGSLFNEGTVSPGHSPGIQNYDSFAQSADGTLQIEIGGLNPGPGSPNVDDGYDQVNVSGTAALDGTLEVTLINDFVPSDGDTFDVLTFGSVSGRFADGEGLYGFGDGSLYFEVVQQADRLQLVAREVPALGDV